MTNIYTEYLQFNASPAQERMWFLQEVEPETTAYNINALYEISGDINFNILEDTLMDIVSRHEILRTSFALDNGQLLQVVHSTEKSKSKLAVRTCQNEEIKKLIDDKIKEPFDLNTVQLFDLNIYMTTNKKFLLVRMHHIISDGTSMGIFLSELVKIYTNKQNNQNRDLEELPIQYIDYTNWVNTEGSYKKRDLEFWKNKLSSQSNNLEFPTTVDISIKKSDAGEVVKRVSKDLVEDLRQVSKENNTTLFATLLSIYKILLAKYTNQNEILVGTPVSNRNLSETKDLIGLFVNTVVIKSTMNNEECLSNFSKQVRDNCIEAFEKQSVPFDKIVEIIQPDRTHGNTPLIQTMFTLQNNIENTLNFPNAIAKYIHLPDREAKFDFTLTVKESENDCLLVFSYRKRLYQKDFIKQFANHFHNLMEMYLKNFSNKISEISLLTEKEKAELVKKTNNLNNNQKSLRDLFEEQVIKSPMDIALISDDGNHNCSYRQLNMDANRLGRYLVNKGIRPNDRVGLLLNDSKEIITAILATWKIGATYIPIDPDFPEERINYIVGESNLKALITVESDYLKSLQNKYLEYILLEMTDPLISEEDDGNIDILIPEDHLAYIMYTSGSTGLPKGVMVPYKGVVNRILFGDEVYQMKQDDCVLQKTPYTFDVSVWEMFWPLFNGQALVLTKRNGQKDINYLIDVINTHKITIAHFIPSIMNLFLDNERSKTCQSLNIVFCSGEELKTITKNRFLETFEAELFNFYGPTETSIEVTYHKCKYNDEKIVPIGRAITNVDTYVLDRFLVPVPKGVIAELYIGGVAVTKGYLNRKELTDSSFLVNPFKDDGSRLYKTGDLVKYNEVGELLYIGRVDNQIKINGNRVELTEVENVIRSIPYIRDVIVLDSQSKFGDKILTAFLKIGGSISLMNLKENLKEHLPQYMIPTKFVKTEEFPLNASGKSDRKALLNQLDNLEELEEGNLDSFSPKVFQPIPRDEIESRLLSIWEELLGKSKIGIRDNFFEIGGYSLLLVRLVDRITREFNTSLPISIIIKNANIEDIAVMIRRQRNIDQKSKTNLIEIRDTNTLSSQRLICFFHPVGGTLWPYIELLRNLHPDIKAIGFEMMNVDKASIDISLKETAQNYLNQLLKYKHITEDTQLILAGYSYGGNLAYEVSKRLIEMGKFKIKLVLFDCFLPNTLENTDDYYFVNKYLKRFEQKEIIKDILLSDNQIQKLSETQLIEYILELSLKTGYLPKDADFQTVKNDFYPWVYNQKAYHNYNPQPIDDVDTLFFKAKDSHKDSLIGWNNLIANIEVILTEGNHYSMLRLPNVNLISDYINEKLSNENTIEIKES